MTADARMKIGTAMACVVFACAALPATGRAQEATNALEGQVRVKPPQPAKPQPKPQPVTVPARRQPGRPGSVEASAAVSWLGPGSLGSSTAQLSSNGSSTPFTLFDTTARMGGAPGLDARVAYNLTRRVAVEGGFVFSRPSVTFTASGDAEGAADFTGSGESLSQYFVDGSLLLFLPKPAVARGRGRVFLEGGVGYLRQLHAGNFNVDTGTVYNGGAGLKYYFKPRLKGLAKALGLRMDGRAYYKRGGFTFDGGNTWTLSLSGGVLVAF